MNAKKYFASCPRGLEDTLLKETEKFDFEHVELTRGGLSFKATIPQALSFLFETRIGSRVYKEIGSFQFFKEKDIYAAAKEIPWTKILNNDQTLKISCVISREVKNRFRNSHHLSLVRKDAIVDSFREKTGRRPSIDVADPDYSLLLRIEPDPKKGLRGIVSVDMAGVPLHARGYRMSGHEAPIKENLAAGLLMNSTWDKESPLYDPFCGSGTFLLEAAMMAYNIAPSYLRLKAFLEGKGVFSLERQKWFQRDESAQTIMRNLATELVTRSEQSLKKEHKAVFRAADKDPRVLRMVQDSWKKMNFPEQALKTYHANALSFYPEEGEDSGVMITNPPYGVRLEDKNDELEKLYYDLGENLKKNWKGYNCFIVNEDAALRKKISLRTEGRFTFWNGPLECRLLHYSIF